MTMALMTQAGFPHSTPLPSPSGEATAVPARSCPRATVPVPLHKQRQRKSPFVAAALLTQLELQRGSSCSRASPTARGEAEPPWPPGHSSPCPIPWARGQWGDVTQLLLGVSLELESGDCSPKEPSRAFSCSHIQGCRAGMALGGTGDMPCSGPHWLSPSPVPWMFPAPLDRHRWIQLGPTGFSLPGS